MFLLHIVLAWSVLSYTNSASIAQHEDEYQALTSQRNLRKETHTITDLATSFWSELPLKFQINKGWERSKQFAEMLANKTLQVFDSLSIPAMTNNNDTVTAVSQNSSSRTAVNQTKANVVNSTAEQHLEIKINSSTIYPMKTSESSSSENGINNEDDKCEESPDLSCLNWKILKVVGSALGAGFVLGLFSPVLFYFAIITVGGVGYGIIFIFSAIICKFKKGRAAAEHFAARCQQIGAFSLQNMFRLFPIILTWLGSGCLIGWLMWPKF